MKSLVERIVTALVDNPEEVDVKETVGSSIVILEISVGNDDVGKIIGKEGRIANAIRTVVKAAAAHQTDRSILPKASGWDPPSTTYKTVEEINNKLIDIKNEKINSFLLSYIAEVTLCIAEEKRPNLINENNLTPLKILKRKPSFSPTKKRGKIAIKSIIAQIENIYFILPLNPWNWLNWPTAINREIYSKVKIIPNKIRDKSK